MGIADEYLLGRELESIERFGFSWQFQFGSGITLNVEAGWRFVNDEGIEVTSEDDGQKFGLPAPVDAAALGMSVVKGKSVTEVQIAPCADLIITFGRALRLEVINLSSGFEAWTLSRPGLPIVVGRNGDFDGATK